MLYSIWFYDLSSLSQCKKAEWYLWNAELTNQGFFLFIFISVVFLKNFLKEQSFCVSNIFKHILKQKTEHPLSKVKAVLEAARAVGNGKLKRCYWCCWGKKIFQIYSFGMLTEQLMLRIRKLALLQSCDLSVQPSGY